MTLSLRILVILAALGSLLVLSTVPSKAQNGDEPAISLIAGQISVDAQAGQLVASDGVEVFYGPARLTTPELRFDQSTDVISATGPIRLETGEGIVFLANMAELSADLRAGLISGVRLLLEDRFQIAAVEARRTDGRYNTLYKTVASSCRICRDNPTPVWQVRARSIVHDEAKERIYFENAVLEVFGLPVAYLPRLRIPAPGVARASGFLVPRLSNSDVNGLGLKIPYYQTLGPHADFTLTPFLSSEGPFVLETEYRQNLRTGSFVLEGAMALGGGQADQFGRGFFNADAEFTLPRDFDLDISLSIASDDEFLSEFSYSDDDRLNSFVSANRYGANGFVDIRAEAYQTLRDAEDQGTIPIVFPKVEYRKVWHDGVLPGAAGVRANLLGLGRTEGRDVFRAGLGGDWRLDRVTAQGIQLAALTDIAAEVYLTRDDATFDSSSFRVTPTVGAELRWPLILNTGSAAHVVEPVAQILYTGTTGDDDVPNEDSLLPELDETNLFSINRFPGLDAKETGLRLNYGLNYTRYDPAGWNLGATIGQVLRTGDDPGFSEGTGLSTEQSDFVTAVSFSLPPQFSLIGRALFDTELDFRRAEMELGMDLDRISTTTSYTFLAEDDSNPDLGLVPRREEIGFETSYQFRPQWLFEGEWRYDLVENASIDGSAGLIYGNECIELELSLSRRFTSSTNIQPNTEISLEIRLAGFGTGTRDWPARQCQG